MLTVAGIFKNGHVELLEDVKDVDEAKVLVTFVENGDASLKELGLDEADAVELRAQFESFEDWNDPAMDVYNDYDHARERLN